MDFKQKKP